MMPPPRPGRQARSHMGAPPGERPADLGSGDSCYQAEPQRRETAAGQEQTSDSSRRIRPPCGRCTNAAAQIKTATARTMAAMPVPRKLGSTVSAGSQPCQAVRGRQGEPMAWINSPPGAALPCCNSNKPCSSPSSPAPAPNAVATARAALTSRARGAPAARGRRRHPRGMTTQVVPGMYRRRDPNPPSTMDGRTHRQQQGRPQRDPPAGPMAPPARETASHHLSLRQGHRQPVTCPGRAITPPRH